VLHGLMLDLAAAADTNHAFPVGTAPLTPATPCCAAADRECSHDPAPWEVDPWKTIGFRYAPAHLQYDYTSDGKTFTAHAVFDEKCDGAIGKVTLEGRIKGKKFQYKVEDPE